ncbi:MAG TPA: DUF2330 domain-containing protein, partial [Fimbriimonadaceae bacterium]|nr:DUF2330 domain-containing protein [Fimbriimonadaceae bacterium]
MQRGRIFLCAVGLLALASIVLPCCLAFPAKSPMSLVDEKAVIVWNPDTKEEHFIRQAAFDGSAKNFGFIVPAPTLPKVAAVDGSVFSTLDDFVQANNSPSNGIGCGQSRTDSATTAGGVDVVDQYMVGDYEATILKATDGKSMSEWLEKNGYSTRDAMTKWLDHYAQMGWFFAALKFVRAKDADTPETKAVRVTFTTDVPCYPYKMPTDTWPSGHYRPLALYFIGPGIARAQYRGDSKDWEAKIVWSGKIGKDLSKSLADALGLKMEDVPPDFTVTAFLNTRDSRGYDHDLFFLTYFQVLPTWAVFAVVLGIAGYVYWLVKT